MNNIPEYTISINLTRACNFRCKYCYEKNSHTENDYLNINDLDKIFNFINILKKSEDFINKGFSKIRIMFFGGEPCLNMEVIKNFFIKYATDNFMVFSLITNGYYIKDLHSFIEENNLSSIKRRLHIQISYDGAEIHNITRKDKTGNITTGIVKDNLLFMLKHGYHVTTKSTVTFDTFKYLFSAYLEHRELESLGISNFFPTIDYFNINDDLHLDDLSESLIKIASYEAEYFKNRKGFFFEWFRPNNRKLCGAGLGMIGIDTDLKIYPCHGAFYENKEDHLISSINNENVIAEIKNHRDKLIVKESKLCSNCSADTCYKCNIQKYRLSNKINYNDRWNDHTNQPQLCACYKFISKVKKALYSIIN